MNVRSLNRYFYADSIEAFSSRGTDEIVGTIAIANSFPLTVEQRDAWVMQIAILREVFTRLAVPGHLYFEYSIPRLGRRVDAVVLAGGVLFVIEFKVGEAGYPAHAVDQEWDRAARPCEVPSRRATSPRGYSRRRTNPNDTLTGSQQYFSTVLGESPRCGSHTPTRSGGQKGSLRLNVDCITLANGRRNAPAVIHR